MSQSDGDRPVGEPVVRQVSRPITGIDFSAAGVMAHLERILDEERKCGRIAGDAYSEALSAVRTLRRALCKNREGA